MTRPSVLSVKDIDIMIISAPSESQHVRIVPSDDVDDSKVVENVYVFSKAASIIEGISVGSDTSIIDEVHISFNSTRDDVDEI